MKQNILAGFCWMVIIGLLIAGLMACGLFKRSVNKDHVRVTTEKTDQSVIIEQSRDRERLQEQEILEIEVRIPPKPQDRPDTVDYQTLNEAIVAAIRDADHLSLRISTLKEENRSQGQKLDENRNIRESLDSLNSRKSSSAEGNTSLLANVPSFVWWIVIPVLLLFLYLGLKKWRVI